MNPVLKNILKLLRGGMYFFLLLIVLFLTALYTLRFSFIQNQIRPYAEEFLSEQLKTRVQIGHIELALWDYLVIKDIAIWDQQSQPMIRLKELKLSLIRTSIPGWLSGQKEGKLIHVREIELTEPGFLLYHLDSTGVLNLDFLLGEDSDSSTTSTSLPKIEIEQLLLWDGKFTYLDSFGDPGAFQVKQGLNFSHLILDSIQADLTFALSHSGDINAQVRQLCTRDLWSGFVLDSFKTQLTSSTQITNREMEIMDPFTKTIKTVECYESYPFVILENTLIKSTGSRIDADIHLQNETLADLIDPNLKEDWQVTFRNSQVHPTTLNYFSPTRLPFYAAVSLFGKITGDINHLKSQALLLGIGEDSWLHTKVRINDILADNPMSFEIGVDSSFIKISEIQQLIGSVKIPEEINRIKEVRIKGKCTGLPEDFVVSTRIITPVGNLSADLLHLQFPENSLTYSGAIQGREIQLNYLLNRNDISSHLNFSSQVEGKGISLSELEGKIELQVTKSDISGYSLDSLITKLDFSPYKVVGPMDILDTKGTIHTQVDLTFKPDHYAVDIKGDIQQINLQALELTQDSLFVSSILNIDLEGSQLKDIEGTIRIFETQIHRRGLDSLFLDPLVIRAEKVAENKEIIKIKSDLLSAEINLGQGYTESVEVFSRLGKEAIMFFNNKDSVTQKYYSQKKDSIQNQFVGIELFLAEIDPVLSFLRIPLLISSGSQLSSEIKTGATDQCSFTFSSDSFKVANQKIYNCNLSGDFFKSATTGDVLAQSQITIGEIFIENQVSFQNVSIEPIWSGKEIEFMVYAEQDSFNNKINIQGVTQFKNNEIEINITDNNSSLFLAGNLWTFTGRNRFVYYNSSGDLLIDNLKIDDNTGQSLQVYGSLTEKKGEGLVIKLEKVELKTIDQITGSEQGLEGKIDAQFMLNDLRTTPFIQGYAYVHEFGFRKLKYGDIGMNAVWHQELNLLSLDATLQKDGKKLLEISGNYNLNHKTSPLDFKLVSYNLPLQLAEPFMEGQIYDLKGSVELNEFTAKGTLDKPIITGNGYFKDVSFMVDYTKTRYRFTGNIRFNDRNINFLNIKIYDERKVGVTSEENYAQLRGYIYHQGFRDFKFNIELESIRNFMVFNTKEGENSLFYGKMIIKDGVASIDGDLETIRLTTFVETGAGTIINIPLTDYTESSSLDYVTFLQEGKIEEDIRQQLNLSGFELKITVNATPDAVCRIIFDERTGEIIEARGTGNIELEITPDGDFTMRGNYEIEKGEYLFTLQNGTIQKKFFIDKGSRITWTGNPYDANIQVTAYYLVYASVADLMGPNSGATNRIPVRVLLNMRGSLLGPEITLNIDAQNLNSQASAEVSSKLKAITADPQSLNQQVFFLLLFSRFYNSTGSAGATTAGGTGGARGENGVNSSLSELLSNQLNYWLSQSFGNNLTANISSNQFQNITLALQARLFNDRITVERNGAITGTNNSNVTIGNINVQVKLLPAAKRAFRRRKTNPNPGTLTFEIFNREQIGLSGNNAVSQGAGFFYRKDFNHFNELWNPRKYLSTAPPPKFPLSSPIDTLQK